MIQLTYKKARQARQLIAALLTSQSITYDDRLLLRNEKSRIDTLCAVQDWNFSCCQETFNEMKTHKSIIDNADNLERLIEKNQSKKLTILNEVVSYDYSLIFFSCDFSSDNEKQNDYVQICEELNGVILNYK